MGDMYSQMIWYSQKNCKNYFTDGSREFAHKKERTPHKKERTPHNEKRIPH